MADVEELKKKIFAGLSFGTANAETTKEIMNELIALLDQSVATGDYRVERDSIMGCTAENIRDGNHESMSFDKIVNLLNTLTAQSEADKKRIEAQDESLTDIRRMLAEADIDETSHIEDMVSMVINQAEADRGRIDELEFDEKTLTGTIGIREAHVHSLTTTNEALAKENERLKGEIGGIGITATLNAFRLNNGGYRSKELASIIGTIVRSCRQALSVDEPDKKGEEG